MNIKHIYTVKNNVDEAVSDIKQQLEGFDAKLLLFFASSVFEPCRLSSLMHSSFPASEVFGCSTSGEIISGKLLKNSIVAMAFDSEVLQDLKIEVVENIKEDGDVKKAFRSFEEYYKEPMSTADYFKYVGIILIDGLSASEEKIMDKVGDFTNCVFIGGSAGDDLKFQKTYIYSAGKVYADAALLAMLKPKKGFDIIKTQSFEVTDKKLVATKVNLEQREVVEFNGKPAVAAYAEAVGVPKEDAANYFMSNPVGLVVDGEIFVRSPQRIIDDKIVFYCNILEGMEVTVLKSKDIVEDTKAALECKLKELGGISGIVNFHCILRTLELEQKGQCQSYGEIFANIPTVGFSTYGEEYLGHINQTSTMLVFK